MAGAIDRAGAKGPLAGVPLGSPGTTNMLRIASVGPSGDADM